MSANGWEEWGRYVLKNIEEIKASQVKIQKDITEIKVNVGMLQVRAGAIGMVAGLVAGLMGKFIKL